MLTFIKIVGAVLIYDDERKTIGVDSGTENLITLSYKTIVNGAYAPYFMNPNA